MTARTPNAMRKQVLLVSLVAAAALLAGCGDRNKGPDGDAVRAEAERRAYEKTIQDWRVERLERLQRPAGWLSLVGMHWLEEGATRVGTNEKFQTRLAVGPNDLGTMILGKDRSLTFQPAPDAGVLVDGQPATGPFRIVPDSAGEPTVVGFNKGDASFIVIERGGKFALRVRDALATTRTQFTGIDSFPVDAQWRFKAKFTPKPPGTKIDIVNILSQVEPMDNPGTLTFEKDGESYTLETIDEGDHRLFMTFADGTSGHESYPAARFVYADWPGPDGTTILDFNKAYNPPCAFTAFSTCPMPPLSNRLPLRITAGEKKPRKIGAAAP
jgi:uncharacterized protein (DUF1684 family)